MDLLFTFTLAALRHDPHATPMDIERILNDDDYRIALARKLDNPAAQKFLITTYTDFSDGDKAQWRQPVLNRTHVFYGSRAIYRTFCHPEPLPLRQYMDEKKIILCDLSSPVIRAQVENIGSMLMTAFQIAALSRADQPEEERIPFYLFIDETQNFVTTSLSTVLAEARKYKLSLNLANQYISQLAGDTLDAIEGNTGTTIMFRVGPRDARTWQLFMQPEFEALDLANLNRFETAVKMQVGGNTQPAFSMKTRRPIEVPDDAEEREARIRQKSIDQYTPWTTQQVDDLLDKRYPLPGVEGPTNGGDIEDDEWET